MKTEKTESKKGTVLAIADTNNFDSMPDLDKAKTIDCDLVPEYWTPENKGDKRRCIFVGMESHEFIDEVNGGEMKQLKSASFMHKEGNTWKKFTNSSTKLINTLESVKVNTALEITYKGKEKNKTNAFSHDAWEIKYLTA